MYESSNKQATWIIYFFQNSKDFVMVLISCNKNFFYAAGISLGICYTAYTGYIFFYLLYVIEIEVIEWGNWNILWFSLSLWGYYNLWTYYNLL